MPPYLDKCPPPLKITLIFMIFYCVKVSILHLKNIFLELFWKTPSSHVNFSSIFYFFKSKITIAIFTKKDKALMPFLLTYAQNIAISKQNHVFGQKFLVWVIVWVIALNGWYSCAHLGSQAVGAHGTNSLRAEIYTRAA